MTSVDQAAWQQFLTNSPQAHILQTPAWGQLKAKFNWTPGWVISGSLGAQILFQDLALGFRVAYLPRGPVSLDGSLVENPNWKTFQERLDGYCQEHGAVFLKVEPDGWEEKLPTFPGYRISSHSIQPPRTIVVSLKETEEEILGRMKSKTRYNIRLAGRKGVTVRQLDIVQPFYDLLENTAERADFGIHTREYYREAFNLFHTQGECALFLAEFEGVPLASIMIFQRGTRSWYFYGASSRQHRDLMATYLVQWEAMRWAKKQGCLSYDLWGVPDWEFEELEDQFLERSDGLWGVYRFKRGFGGDLKRSPGPWDRIYRPGIYKLYQLRNKLSGMDQ